MEPFTPESVETADDRASSGDEEHRSEGRLSKLFSIFTLRRAGKTREGDDGAVQPAEAASAATPLTHDAAALSEDFVFVQPPNLEEDFIFVNPSQTAPEEQMTPEPDGEEVYYLTGEGRMGPVRLSEVFRMVSDGELDLVTPLCKKGSSEWLTFTEYLKAREARKPAAKVRVPAAVPWEAAVAPLLGGLVPVLITQLWISWGHKPLPFQPHLWWIVPVVSSAFCFLDCRSLKGSGAEVDRSNFWFSLVPPLYLYRRVKSALALVFTFLVWCGSCLVALAGFVLVNEYNAPLLTVVERMVHVQRHLP